MSRVPVLRLGRLPGGVVECALHGRAITGPDDWLHAEVTVSAGAFSGSYFGYVRVAALAELRAGLAEGRRASLECADGGLAVRLAPERDGFTGTVEASDDPGGATRLEFGVRVPGGDVLAVLDALDAAVAEFSAPGRSR